MSFILGDGVRDVIISGEFICPSPVAILYARTVEEYLISSSSIYIIKLLRMLRYS